MRPKSGAGGGGVHQRDVVVHVDRQHLQSVQLDQGPGVAALLGVSLLHERLGLGGILAFVMILLGSWLATRGAAAHHSRPAEAI